jgi:hypothetical protein
VKTTPIGSTPCSLPTSCTVVKTTLIVSTFDGQYCFGWLLMTVTDQVPMYGSTEVKFTDILILGSLILWKHSQSLFILVDNIPLASQTDNDGASIEGAAQQDLAGGLQSSLWFVCRECLQPSTRVNSYILYPQQQSQGNTGPHPQLGCIHRRISANKGNTCAYGAIDSQQPCLYFNISQRRSAWSMKTAIYELTAKV